MSAGDHVQPQQLAMFMSSKEILATHTSAEVLPVNGGSVQRQTKHLWDRKLAESKMNKHEAYGPVSRYDSIKQEGVKTPIDLVHHYEERLMSSGTNKIVEGHHRIASQNDQDPDKLMPVLHHEDMSNYRSQGVGKAYRGHV